MSDSHRPTRAPSTYRWSHPGRGRCSGIIAPHWRSLAPCRVSYKSPLSTVIIGNFDVLDIQPSRIGQAPVIDRHPHVQLGQRDLESEIRKEVERLGKVVRDAAADKVALKAVPVKRLALVQERFCEREMSKRLVADGFNVVVVYIELDIGCGRAGVVELHHQYHPLSKQLSNDIPRCRQSPHRADYRRRCRARYRRREWLNVSTWQRPRDWEKTHAHSQRRYEPDDHHTVPEQR